MMVIPAGKQVLQNRNSLNPFLFPLNPFLLFIASHAAILAAWIIY